jgi:hypothetical protein
MGFRFRKTIKILPGIKLNLSKSGVSTSIGVKGATVNVKKGRATKTTLGIPGTGISYTSHSPTSKPKQADSSHISYDETRLSDHENAKRKVAALMQERSSGHDRWATIKAFFAGMFGR